MTVESDRDEERQVNTVVRQLETNKKNRRSGREPMKFWYASHPFLRSREGREAARRIARSLRRPGDPPAAWGEEELFRALHTCAYWASSCRRGAVEDASVRRKWARRWRVIREHIVSANLGLVYSTAQRFQHNGLDDDDVLSDAMYALMCAVDKFNPWRGFRFSTYACNCIVRACMRRGRREQRRRELSPVNFDPEMERPSDPPDFAGSLWLERLRAALATNAGDLTPLESTVLAERFPRGGDRKVTFARIGRRIGLSKERVRQIQNSALYKLRIALEADPLLG